MGLGQDEAERAGLGRRAGVGGGAPPPVRYQSTAESRTHARITTQGLGSQEASRGGLLPISGQAQRLPISPPQSGANRRGQLPYPSVATAGTDAHEGACALRSLALGGGAGACWAPEQGGERPTPSLTRGRPRASASRLAPFSRALRDLVL